VQKESQGQKKTEIGEEKRDRGKVRGNVKGYIGVTGGKTNLSKGGGSKVVKKLGPT